jgi:hypothetical protein
LNHRQQCPLERQRQESNDQPLHRVDPPQHRLELLGSLDRPQTAAPPVQNLIAATKRVVLRSQGLRKSITSLGESAWSAYRAMVPVEARSACSQNCSRCLALGSTSTAPVPPPTQVHRRGRGTTLGSSSPSVMPRRPLTLAFHTSALQALHVEHPT